MNINRERPLLKVDWFAKNFSTNFDVGIYKELGQKDNAKTLTKHLEDVRNDWLLENKQPMSPYYGMSRSEIIRFKNAMMTQGKTPPMEAIDELMFSAGIRHKGAYTDIIDNVFKYGDTDVILPEIIANRVHYSMLATSILPALLMGEITIDGTDYRKVYLADAEPSLKTGIVTKGDELPRLEITISKQTIRLPRYGAYVVINYDDWKYESFGMFNSVLDLIGQQIDVDRTDDALTTFQNGDGNSNTPDKTITTTTTDVIVLADIINCIIGLSAPYRPNNAVGKAAMMAKWLAVVYGMNAPWSSYNGGLEIPKAYVWDRTCITSDLILLQDSRFSLQYITQDSMLVDTENIVRRSEKGFAISYRGCPSVFDKKANGVLDVTH
jgi:hypothetical protein